MITPRLIKTLSTDAAIVQAEGIAARATAGTLIKEVDFRYSDARGTMVGSGSPLQL